MRKRGVGQQRDARIVQNFAVFDHAAVAVAGVFAQADVGDHEQIELGFANRFDRKLHRAGCRGGFRAGFVLVLGQAEKNHGGNAEVGDFAALFDDLIGRLLENARHGADFRAHFGARARKHRIDQAAGRKLRFADEPAQRFGAAQAARTM